MPARTSATISAAISATPETGVSRHSSSADHPAYSQRGTGEDFMSLLSALLGGCARSAGKITNRSNTTDSSFAPRRSRARASTRRRGSSNVRSTACAGAPVHPGRCVRFLRRRGDLHARQGAADRRSARRADVRVGLLEAGRPAAAKSSLSHGAAGSSAGRSSPHILLADAFGSAGFGGASPV